MRESEEENWRERHTHTQTEGEREIPTHKEENRRGSGIIEKERV